MTDETNVTQTEEVIDHETIQTAVNDLCDFFSERQVSPGVGYMAMTVLIKKFELENDFSINEVFDA